MEFSSTITQNYPPLVWGKSAKHRNGEYITLDSKVTECFREAQGSAPWLVRARKRNGK